MANFGELLKTFRLEKGLSQIGLANELGLSQTAIASYERGDRKPRQNRMVKIAQYFSVSPNELLGYEPQVDSYSIEGLITTPVLNTLPFHISIDDESYIVRYTYLPDDGRYRASNVFVLIAWDDAMSGYSRIQQNDALIIMSDKTIEDGDIVVVHVQQEDAIVRRVYYPDDTPYVLLVADNAYYRPITVSREDISIRGKVEQVLFYPE
ncbi:hypothetical protein AAV35_14210 [Salimicrobium jeotgali]|uniref:Putative prophage repressor n=1 Tax=Salimicrobium jeotgali TaxID=1230341 RepID=K2GAE6_9BACI|nr:XRE family transcriptional regulator [Salimicrobium jeotgali]APC65604.1 hypothetical protein AAV35_14210 [Salimicrobium jeotgali]EKE31317.1 putative prophage repressor [Salimicrobium jeotgali]